MVEIWREKDEGLQKFQKLCKYRVIQIIKAKTEYENSPEGKEYEKEMKQLNEQIKKEKIMEEKKRKEEEEKAKKSQLLKSYTMKKAVVNKFNPYKDIMIDINASTSKRIIILFLFIFGFFSMLYRLLLLLI